jgi:type III restriction enzyme
VSAKPLQTQVIEAITRRVDKWRGFTLGKASEPYPEQAPRYEPLADGERNVSDTTMALLQHWFRREPHLLGAEGHTVAFKYWPHQRRLVETFIYLYEVLGIRRTEDLYRFARVEPLGPQRDPWAKLGGQLATGSGKTKMMSLLIAWCYLNAVCEPENDLGLGRHAILIAPGLFVKDRLLQDFAPTDGGVAVFSSDPVVPPELLNYWHLKVYDPTTCPRSLDPDDGALVVTNYHQLLRTRDELEQPPAGLEDKQLQILFGEPDPERLEAVKSPLLDRFGKSKGLLVLNDEAHHVWDEPGHAVFEEKARQKATASDEEAEAMAWIRSIRRLNGSETAPGRVGLQIDLSATLFQETGTTTQTKKKTKKGQSEVQFKENELFRHTVVTYDLAEAIRDGIVKKPILERVEVRNEKTGAPLPLVQPAAPNAWKKYENLLVTGIQRWKKVRDQLRAEGDDRKPILFVLCADKGEAAEVANFLTYGEATRDDLEGKSVTGFVETGGEKLFVEKGKDGIARSTVVQIHIGQKEEANEEEWEKVRLQVNAIDRDEIERRDDSGNMVLLPNPYNVVVSVMMLKEGWDVRNVKVIIPLRPCGSRTLTEQTLGRGLRKMHPPIIDDEGAASMTTEELYVMQHPSFQEVIDQHLVDDLIEQKSSDEIDHPPDYIAVPPLEEEEERQAVDVRLVRVGDQRPGARDWRKDVDVAKLAGLAPRIPWLAEIDRTAIKTWLIEALKKGEQEGQEFTFPTEPSYRDFDHIIEVAFAVPLLRELRVGFQHKNAVKDIVREFLERKTFALPAGIPIRFDEVKEPADATIALGNLSRPEVGEAVRKALLRPIGDAIRSSLRPNRADLIERRASQVSGYQALKQNVLDGLKKSPFQRLAGTNPEERRLAVLLEDSRDVVGWIFNHRSGVGYSIPYDWKGYIARYFPDFIVRAKFGAVFHNFIIEVKGRLDDKDKAKALRGRRWCEDLTKHDIEPWHYLLLMENKPLNREDITWWEGCSVRSIEDLLRRHENLPLLPDAGESRADGLKVLASVGSEEQYRSAVPVFDLAVKAGSWGNEVAPEAVGWVRLPGRQLDNTIFVAQVVGHSMEPGIPDGAWGLFRSFPVGDQMSATALDGRRVVARLPSRSDPETGTYTLKRWKVTKVGPDAEVLEVTLRPDNRAVEPLVVKPTDGDLKVVAEYLETVG